MPEKGLPPQADPAKESGGSGDPYPTKAPFEPGDAVRINLDMRLDAIKERGLLNTTLIQRVETRVNLLFERLEEIKQLLIHNKEPLKDYAKCEKCGALNFYSGSGTWGCGACDADLIPARPFPRKPPGLEPRL